MDQHYSFQLFYKELMHELPTSDGKKRQRWAKSIVENEIDLTELSQLLNEDKTIAMRYAWLLTDVALVNQEKLSAALPFLFQKAKNIRHFTFIESFANYWLIVGVPNEQEAEAIDLLFKWIRSNQVNITIKSRSIKVILKLTKKHPDLKNELSILLKEQQNRHSTTFKTMVGKALAELNSG